MPPPQICFGLQSSDAAQPFRHAPIGEIHCHISGWRASRKFSAPAGAFDQPIAQPSMRGTRELRIEDSFGKFKNKERLMRTKTAILSIAELKAEDLPKLREAFQALPGVGKIDFSLERSVAVLDFDPSRAHIDDFLRAALKAGFQVL
jgi:hypothetical protein